MIKLELRKILKRFVSVRDLAAKAPPELYYQGFMNGLFSNSANCLDDFASNAEAGDGYADAILRSADLDTGVILEYKSVNDPCLLDKMSDQALKQIDEKRYAEFFLKSGSIPKNILGYGIAFCRKECSVSMARLDPLKLL
ncbi:MAG: PD-(D/E)XK nuclease domain-containing protein [Succinatimonas sp.]|nr:PD-(D/E)XK nuclease domain-containing protein [Succinatimonas sp.]